MTKRNPLSFALMIVVLSIIISVFGTLGCASDDSTIPASDAGSVSDTSVTIPTDTNQTPQPDSVAPDTSAPDTKAAPTCGTPDTYPCGPYGTQTDDVVANLEFDGFADIGYLCKAPQDMQRDLSVVRKLSFRDWYVGSPNCPQNKKKLLWVMVSAGWCGPCHDEVMLTQSQYAVGAIDDRVAVINVIYQDDDGKPATTEFVKLWGENGKFQLDFPVAADPQFQMGKYFNSNAVPFNMLIDLETMKIVFRITGANLPAVGKAMQDFLNK